jgi:tRNA modification GTPase
MAVLFRVLTAEGRGAIAVVRLWGPGALQVADSLFRPHRGGSLASTPAGRLRLGRAGVGRGDEIVAVRLPGTVPMIEFQGHGGAAAVAAIVGALEGAGAARADRDPGPGASAGDRIREQAMEDLASAPTLNAAEILLDQARGAFSRSLDRLINEAERGPRPDSGELDALIRRAGIGLRLLQGWKVVIAGRPNVGKSRLFNALAGFERSIVDAAPGVTRDVVSLRTAFGGWPVDLCDTAGERITGDVVESLGIGRARRERHDADLVILVLDRSEPLQDMDLELLQAMPRALIVANKCDLPASWDVDSVRISGSMVHAVSAETGQSLDELVRVIVPRLIPEAPTSGEAVPFRHEHVRRLEQARDCLVRGDLDGFQLRLGDLRLVEGSP